MALYEIHIRVKGNTSVTIYKEKNNAKAAYEYALAEGLDIFGETPESVSIIEPKPA
jgi:hypothetical protein